MADRKPPGLPSVYQARADRERGRYSRGSPAIWLGVLLCLATTVIAYRWVEERKLGHSKETLLAKEHAVLATVGQAWFPLRDEVEKRVLDAARESQPDFVDPAVKGWAFRSKPGLYLRIRLADAKDVTTLRRAAASSQRDGFVGCLLREPSPAAAEGKPDASAFAEQPWNWQKAYAATRILTNDWTDEVNASEDPLRLKVFEEQYDKAMKSEIPQAIELVREAEFLLFVLDEDSPDVRPAEAGAPTTEADLQKAPHIARVHLVDLKRNQEVLRVRRSAEAGFVFAGEQRVSDPETLDALQRQVNNCALAKAVDRAIDEATSKEAAPTLR